MHQGPTDYCRYSDGAIEYEDPSLCGHDELAGQHCETRRGKVAVGLDY
jgi:hypothetical protein